MKKYIPKPTQLLSLTAKLRREHSFDNKEEIILRDYLAMERTKLANERTLLGYIRTSLFFLTGGITLLQLEEFEHVDDLGYLAIGVSILLLLIGIIRYFTLGRRLGVFYHQIKKGEKKMKQQQAASAKPAGAASS